MFDLRCSYSNKESSNSNSSINNNNVNNSSMSVPALLTALEARSPSPSWDYAADDDDHMQNCASYVEGSSVAAIVPIDMLAGAPAAAGQTAPITGAAAAAAAACLPTLRHFTLQLRTPLQPHELVGLTGDSKVLGEWQLERSVPLKSEAAGLSWTVRVMMPACREAHYRYFVYTLDPQGHKQIRRWESQLRPRTLSPLAGGGDGELAQVDRFGEGGDATSHDATDTAGVPRLNRGWLTHDAIVQLKFEREQMFQVLDIDAFDPDGVLVKVEPLCGDNSNADAPLPGDGIAAAVAGVHVEVARLVYGHSKLQPQPEHGVAHRRGDVVIFHVTLPQVPATAFAVLFYSPDTHQLVGRAAIGADELRPGAGVLELNVLDGNVAGALVARLTLPYLLVLPFREARRGGTPLDFRTTYAHFWPRSWPNLDIGHRGNGRSYIADAPSERENTLASFRRAHDLLADMVEFDVHLTADGVPVIYHDFGVRTAPQGKKVTHADQLQFVLIKDLSYEQLQRLRVFALIDGAPIEYPSHVAESRAEHRIFPTLRDVLTGLPTTLGMDVEIKWPQLRAGGLNEAAQPTDKNFFVDRVIATVLEHGCGRPLIFSSFDADVCTMLRFKQNRFPVMFLTMGATRKWSPFMDLRTRTFEQAINTAQAFEFAGTAPHAEDFLGPEGEALMQKARQLGQIAIVWGDDCNARERVEYFTAIGATATCYDRTDRNMRDGKERAFFNATELLAEFGDHRGQ